MSQIVKDTTDSNCPQKPLEIGALAHQLWLQKAVIVALNDIRAENRWTSPFISEASAIWFFSLSYVVARCLT